MNAQKILYVDESIQKELRAMKKFAAVKDWALEQGYIQIRKPTKNNPSVSMDFFPAELLQKKTGQPKSHLFYIDPVFLEEIKKVRQFKQFKEEIKKLGYKALKIAKPGKPQTEFNWSMFDEASAKKAN